MSKMPPSTLLLVEGPDDEHVVKNICGRMQIGTIDKIRFEHRGRPSPGNEGTPRNTEQPRGKEALLKALPHYLETRGEELVALGILLDADDDRDASWQSIIGWLRQFGYPDLPEHPDPEGTVIPPTDAPADANHPLPLPRIGIWIMPDNRTDGTLETFLSFLVPEDDKLLPHAERIIDELHTVEPSAEKRFKPVHQKKALMHTWLAWQQEPGKPYGQAITARYLDTRLPIAQTFATWLRDTFWPEP